MYEMNFMEASKIIDDGLFTISLDYEIVEKEETARLLLTIEECRKINEAFQVMRFNQITCEDNGIREEAIMISMLNNQIESKLDLLFKYYISHYNIKLFKNYFENDNSLSKHKQLQKSADYNINLICKEIRSWENE